MNSTGPTFGGALVAAAVLAAAAGGCLDPNFGSTNGTLGGTPDAAVDTASADVSEDTSPPEPDPVEPPPPPCPFTCSDGNECTDDHCDENTGECFHVVRSDGASCDGECGICVGGECVAGATGYPNACETEGCDDGDPCTVDVCACSDDGCGNEHCWCEHVLSPSSACSEQPPPPPPTVCDPTGAITVSDAVYTKNEGDFVKIGGLVAMSWYATCDDSVCGDCYGGLALADANQQVVLDTSTDDDAPWVCETGGCPEVGTCSPLHHGAEYYVWGILHHYNPWGAIPEPGSGEAPSFDYAIDVQGWCLKDVSGTYEGNITHSHGFDIPVTLDVSKQAEGGYSYTLSAMKPCPTCMEQPVQSGPVTVTDDGQLVFQGKVPSWYSVAPVQFTTTSDNHSLHGSFYETGPPVTAADAPGTDSDGAAWVPTSGGISVQRVQNP